MNDSRVDNMADTQFITRLQNLKKNLDALSASAQRVSGTAGTLNYLTKTASTWDFNETIGANDGLTHKATFTVTFTGDGTQQYPDQMCLFDIFINSSVITTGPIEANRLSAQQPQWTDGTITVNLVKSGVITSNYVETYAQSNPTYYTSALTWQWEFVITAFSAQYTYWVKAASLGTSIGTLSVTRTTT